jgi:transcriptional regulator with XRE-family HTH domain
MATTIHIGEIIYQKVKERGMTVSEFAKAIHCNRSRIYTSVFHCHSIDIERLILISGVLHHDFIAEFYQQRPSKKKYLILLEVSELQLQQFLSNPALKGVHQVCE